MGRSFQPIHEEDDQHDVDVGTAPASPTTALSGAGNQAAIDTLNKANVPSVQSPEWVKENRDKLGIPKDVPDEHVFYEFLANGLSYKEYYSNPDYYKNGQQGETGEVGYSKEDLAMLDAWGYQGKPAQEIYDPKTGLYAVRYDPKEGSDRQPVVVFRGTQPTDPQLGGWPDIRTDADDYIGKGQYDANSDAIQQMIAGAGQDVVVTGHSLGGALAQKAAADNVDNIGEVVTYQGPGISYGDAAKFNEANADGHIPVSHHFVASDTVHRAGEARLGGDFYENKVDGFTTTPVLALKDVMDSHLGRMYYQGQAGTERPALRLEHGVQTTKTDTDPVGSRHFHEGMRQKIGGLVAAGEGLWNGASTALGGTWDALKGTGSGLLNAASNTVSGLADAGGTVLDGLGKAGSGLWSGGGQMLSSVFGGGSLSDRAGRFFGGLGEAGGGLLSGAGEALWGGAKGLGSLGMGALESVGAVGKGLWDTGGSLLSGAGQAVMGLGKGALQSLKGDLHLRMVPAELAMWGGEKALEAGAWAGGKLKDGAAWAGDKVSQGANAAWEGTKWAGGKVADGASAAWDGAKWAGGKVADGVGAVGDAIGGGAKAAWDFATGW